MRDEAAGQRAHRHEAPAEHPVDAVDPAEQMRGHDLLAQADRDDVPHGHGEPLAGQHHRGHGRVRGEPEAGEDRRVDRSRDDQRRQHAQPAGHRRTHQPADHAADGRHRQQQPVPAGTDVQRLGGQQHQDGLAHLVGEVKDAEEDGDHAQQAVPVEPAQPLGDLGTDGGPRLARLPAGPGQPGQQSRRAGERGGVQAERQRRGRGEQQAAGRRPEERLSHGQADLLAAVGLGQEFGRHQGGEHRLRGVAEDDFGAAEQQARQAEDRDVRGPEDDRDRHRGDHGGLNRLGPPHERGPVVAVDQRPGRQREHHPRQVAGRGDHRDQPGIPADGHGEQGQRGHEGTVAGAADRVGPPQPPVVRSEPGPAGPSAHRLRHAARLAGTDRSGYVLARR